MTRRALWGHHIEEYQAMFDLHDLDVAILEYGCGVTAFNAASHALGREVKSLDPWFNLDMVSLSTLIEGLFEEKRAEILRRDRDIDSLGGLDALLAYRRAGMAQFFADYAQGLVEKRYAWLPQGSLPLMNGQFDYALSAHFFFQEVITVEDALLRLCELARVAKEVRVFPLNDLDGRPYPLLAPLLLALQQQMHYGIEVRHVPSRVCAQGNAMLRVWAQACAVEPSANTK